MMGFLLTAFLLCYLPQFPSLSQADSSFNLSYNGGKIMTEPATVSLLWFGIGRKESSREVVRNAITSLTPTQYHVLDSEVPTLGNWREIIRQYKDNSNNPITDTVDVGVECFYTSPYLNMT